MALLKPLKSFADFCNTKDSAADCAFAIIETPALYLDLTTKYLKEVQIMMSLKVSTKSPKFNHEQCQYLVDKLKVTVVSASSFLLNQTSTWLESEDMAKSLETFKLLFASAKQVQSFIRSFCKLDAYSLAAVILPNVFEQLSLLDFDLELCRIAFSGSNECGASQNATSASVDKETLLTNILKVLIQCSKSGGEEWLLASFLLERQEKPIQGSSRESRVFEVDYRSLQQEEKLGSGATCTVHKAMWLGAPVAMKMFTGPNHADFKKEVAILAGLSHPNVLTLLCSSMDKRWCAIVTQLMDEDLFSLIQKRVRLHHDGNHDSAPFSDLESIHLILQVAEGMLYLHQNKIVHRDLKSNNILVKFVKANEEEIRVKATKMDIGYAHVKVGDFGLSKTKETSNMHSNQTPNVGTNRWMAPEVIKFQDEDDGSYEEGRGTRFVYDPFKADIYSFAMICYEILTGYVPFSTISNSKEVKNKVLSGERPTWPKEGLEKLKALVEKCWSNDASTRPSFDVICAELRFLKRSLATGKREDKYPALREMSTYSSTAMVSQKSFFALLGNLILKGPVHFYVSHSGRENGSAKYFPMHLFEAMKSTRRYKLNLFTVFFDRISLGESEAWPMVIRRELTKTQVGIVIVTEDFFRHKWPMLELIFLADSYIKNPTRVRLLPLFYGLRPDEVRIRLREGFWDEHWKRMSTGRHPIDANMCRQAVEVLCSSKGIEYCYYDLSFDAEYIEEIVKEVGRICDHMWKHPH